MRRPRPLASHRAGVGTFGRQHDSYPDPSSRPRTINRALRALKRNGWIKFLVRKGRRGKLFYLGDRTKNEAGVLTGESFFADTVIAAAAAAERKLSAGDKDVVVPVFKTLTAA